MPQRNKGTLRQKSTVFLLYLVLSLISTYPIILHLKDHVIGKGGLDSFTYLWNIYAFWQRLLAFKNPFFTQEVHYPYGANLFFHDYSPLTSLLISPIVGNPIIALNLLMILSLAVSCFTTFLLAKHLTSHTRFSFLAGLIYGFSPTMLSFLISQHYYYPLAAMYLPLGILMVIKFFEQGSKYLLFLFLLFWLSFFTNYYSAIMLFLVTFLTFLVLFIHNSISQPRFLNTFFSKDKVGIYAVYLLAGLILPALIVFTFLFRIPDFPQWTENKNLHSNYCNTNVAGFFLPSKANIALNPDTPYYYQGAYFFLLAVTSAVTLRRKNYAVAVSVFGLTLLLLSSGTHIRFGAITLLTGDKTPFYWFSQLPFLGLLDCPIRFSIAVQLAIALLIALFLTSRANSKDWAAKALPYAVFTVFFLDFYQTPIEITPVTVPSVYKELASYQDTRTVLELPSGLTESKDSFGYDGSFSRGLNSKQMYWQTVYKKPRIGGYVSRIPLSTYQFFKGEPIISDIFKMTHYQGKWSGNDFSKSEINQFLTKFNLGYILIAPSPRQQEFVSVISTLLDKSRRGYIKIEKEEYIFYRLLTS